MVANEGDKSFESHFGTISLKSSIFIRPAGVSPILMSINTIGRVVDDIPLREGNLDVVGMVEVCHYISTVRTCKD